MNDQYLDQDQLEDEIVLKHSLSEEIAKWEEKKKKIEKQMVQLDHAMKNLYLDKVKGEIGIDPFKVLSQELEQDKERAKEQYDTSLQKIQELQEQLKTHSDKKKIIQEYTVVKELNRAMVEQLIDYIEVSKRDPVTKILKVEIHWNF